MCVLVGIYIYEKTVKKKYSIIGGQTEYNIMCFTFKNKQYIQ